MSGFPAPRLGRAVRLFTPLAIAGTLSMPLLAGAQDHPKGHGWGVKPGKPAATTPASDAPATPTAEAPAAPQDAPVTTTATTPAAPAAADQPAADPEPTRQTDAVAQGDSSDDGDATLAEAPGLVANSVHGDDDHSGNGHAYGHDKQKPRYKKPKKAKHPKPGHPAHPEHPQHPEHPDHPDHPKPHDDDHGYGHGHDNGGDDKRGDSSQPSSAPAAAPTLQPIASPSLAGLANQVIKPRVCTSRRSLTIRLDRGYKVRAARVLLDGRLLKVVRHNKKVTSTINLRSRARGTYTVRTVVVTKGNKIRIGTRKFTTCAVAKKH